MHRANSWKPQTLLDRARLDRLSRELARKERELADIQTVSALWQGEARSWLDHARELGLVPKTQADPADWPALVDLLRQLTARSFSDADPMPPASMNHSSRSWH